MVPGINPISMTMPTDYSAEQAAIFRRQKLAELMQQQSMQPIEAGASQGPLGSVTAPASWTQGLAKLMQAYSGQKGIKDVEERQKALGQRYQTEGQDALIRGLKAYRGTPEQTIQPDPQEAQQSADFGTPPVGPANVPGVPGSPETAMGIWGSHPMTQGTSQAMLAQLLKGEDPYNLREGEKRFGSGGKVIAENKKVQPGFTLTPGAKRFGPGGDTVASLPEKIDYNKAFLPDGSPNPAYQAYELNKAARGATRVSVDNRALGKYADVVGGKSGENDIEQFSVAQVAKENAEKLDNTLSILKNSDAITGMGADIFKNVERAKVLFANDKKAGKKVSDTEYLNALLGSDVFPMIKELGIGARGLDTPAEREFLREVMSGTINMNKDTLIRMTKIRRDIAQRSMDRWNNRVKSGELDDFFKFANRPKSTIDYKPQTQSNGQWSVVK